jgi:uncharacterized protein (TIGR00369 family)
MTTDEINAFLASAFTGDRRPTVEASSATSATCRVTFHQDQVRPGGTLSGPTMMALADTTAYALVLAAVGFKPLAVTTSLSINFMRKPTQADIVATATMMKLGKALAVMDVGIRSDGDERLVAHAVVTYSIPPDALKEAIDGDPFVAFTEWSSPEDQEAWKTL